MKNSILFLISISLLAACGSGGDKAKQLADLKSEREALTAKIIALEKEVAASDTTAKKMLKVAVTTIGPTMFRNYIDIQAKVDADENITLSPEMPGAITRINVKVGDEVTKGQILAEVDNKVIVQGIAELQNALDLATTMYNKQKNLWDQKIGTEMQYLQVKNQKESLEKKMATMQQQLDMSRIKSPINGTVDAVDIKLGEMAAPGMPAIRVVNFDNLKVKGEVAESYAARIKKGNRVEVFFPDLNDTLTSTLGFAARVINPLNRTFSVHVNLENTKDFHPNMVAVMKIVDYANEKAFIAPIAVVQKAENEEFVFVEQSGKAKKVKVKTGRVYNGVAEVIDGLKEGDKLITKGFQNLNDGDLIKL